MKRSLSWSVGFVLGWGLTAAGEIPGWVEMVALEVNAARVAMDEAPGTISQPITQLRFEPLVDVQTRNLSEAQGDVTIRGGIFEQSGFILGAATLFDPQTGHYFAEIPVGPCFLTAPEVRTGLANAVSSFNTTVGAVAFAWRPVEDGGELGFGLGEDEFRRFNGHWGQTWQVKGGKWGFDIEAAYSESDGTLRNGDHVFSRMGGRLQFVSEEGEWQADLFGGYQSKFFGWPFLYTPFSDEETENLQTSLFFGNVRKVRGSDGYVEFTGYWRKHRDDYEFRRSAPTSLFEHASEVKSVAVAGKEVSGAFFLRYMGQWVEDELLSTNLVHAPFSEGNRTARDYFKGALLPGWVFALSGERFLEVSGGGSYETTSEDGDTFNPVAGIRWVDRVRGAELAFEVVRTTQVPGYTALGSAEESGFFRGNPDLGRETSKQAGLRGAWNWRDWRCSGAVFFREEEDQVDWVFDDSLSATAARRAEAVDNDVWGAEWVFQRSWEKVDLVFGGMWLTKEETYEAPNVVGSFYALNYAEWRGTLGLVVDLGWGWVLRSDNEVRLQAENPLRGSGREAIISALAVSWSAASPEGVTLQVAVDNVWDEDFEEVPGVPASRRQVVAGLMWRF